MEDFETVLASQKAAEEIGKLKGEIESLVTNLGVLNHYGKKLVDIAGCYGVLAIMKTSSNPAEYKFVRELPIRKISRDKPWDRSILVRDIDAWPPGYPINRWVIIASNSIAYIDLVTFALDLLNDKYQALVVDINPLYPVNYEEALCLFNRLKGHQDELTKKEFREVKRFLRQNGFNNE